MITLVGLNDTSHKYQGRLERLIEELQPQIGAIGVSEELLKLYERELPKIKEYIAQKLRGLNVPHKVISYIKTFYEKWLLDPWNTCAGYLKRNLSINFIDDPAYAKELFDSAFNRLRQEVSNIVRNPPSKDRMNNLSLSDMNKRVEEETKIRCKMDSEMIRNPDPMFLLGNLASSRPIKSKYMADRIVDIERDNKYKNVCCFLEPFHLFDDPLGETLYSNLKDRRVNRRLIYDPFLEEDK